MRILVNAMSIKLGGGLVVLQRFLTEFVAQQPDYEWNVVANPQVAQQLQKQVPVVHYHVIPWAERSPVHNSFFYLFALNRLAKKLKATVLFSQTNYLPFRPAVPSLLLVQNAGHFSRVFDELHKKTFPGLLPRLAWWAKGRRVKKSVLAASMVTVQTRVLADAIQRETGISSERIVVIPHGTGICSSGKIRSFPKRERWRIGYITNYGVQKNFADLFAAVAILKKRGHLVTLVLTLGQNDPKNRQLLQQASEMGLDDCIENRGSVAAEQVEDLYDSLDLFVFPSLCESFGFPMVEAMSRGLPIVVADVLVNREVCGEAAMVYRPGHADELAERLSVLMNEAEVYCEASCRSIEQSRLFPWSQAATRTCNVLSLIADAGV